MPSKPIFLPPPRSGTGLVPGASAYSGRRSITIGVGVNPDAYVIPNADLSGQIKPNFANALATDLRQNQQSLIAAADRPVRILYGGPERLAGEFYTGFVSSDQLPFYYLCAIMCEGEIEKIGTSGTTDGNADPTGFEVDGVASPTSPPWGNLNIRKYRGTQTQGVDSWFAAGITTPLAWNLANGADMLGTAYITAQFYGGGRFAGFPQIIAPVYGRKVYDPRSNALKGSNNIGLVADWFVGSGTITATRDQVGPNGATNYAWKLQDANAGVVSSMAQTITGADNGATYAYQLKIKKQAAGPLCQIDLSWVGATPVTVSNVVNPVSGAVSGTSFGTITDLGTYWLLEGTIVNNSSGNTALGVAIYPDQAAAANLGFNVFCEMQVRKTAVGVGSVARSAGYIETPAGASIDQQTVWSANSALCLGDYLASPTYGEGRVVDADSLALAAEFDDQVMGAALYATYTWAANLVTVTYAAHGLVTGASIGVDFTSGAGTPDGTYTATSTGANTFTFPLTGSGTAGNLTFWKTSLAGVNEPRSRMTFLIDQRQPVKTWRDLMRAYVPCWVNIDGDKAYLKLDTTGSVDHTFTFTNTSTDSLIRLSRAGVWDTPNFVIVGWTDTSVKPWKLVTAEADGSAGGVKRKMRIDLPGIRSYSQARRYAIERLNHYLLEDLSVELSVFEEGLKVLPGDLIAITDSDLGLASKEFRVLGADDLVAGRWKIRGREFQPNAYSQVVETAPVFPDITPANINAPPAVTGLALAILSQLENGSWNTRITSAWNPELTWPYVFGWDVEVFEPAVAVTYSITSNVVTVTSVAHGLAVNNSIWADFTSGGAAAFDEQFVVATVADADHFTFALTTGNTTGNISWQKLRQHAFGVRQNTFISEPVVLGATYTVKVRVYSMNGVRGPWASANISQGTPAAGGASAVALNFPAAPTDGQIYTVGVRTFIYSTALVNWIDVSVFVAKRGDTGLGDFSFASGARTLTTTGNGSSLTIAAVSGASLTVYGRAHSTSPGYFVLSAVNIGDDSQLEGKPDGTLTWNPDGAGPFDVHHDGNVGVGATYTPAVTGSTNGGAVTETINSARYTETNERINFDADITIDNINTATGQVRMSLPFTPLENWSGCGTRTDAVFNSVQVIGYGGSAFCDVLEGNATPLLVNGRRFQISGSFRK